MSPYRRYRAGDPRRYATHAHLILGKRGEALLGLGILWVAIAATVVAAPGAHGYVLLSVDDGPRAAAWIVTGVTAAVMAWRSDADAIGFVALYIMPAYQVVAYAVGFIDWLLDGVGGDGNPRGIVGAVAWLSVCYLLLVIAGWREPQNVTDEREAGSG